MLNLNFSPFPELTTHRLHLRGILPGDDERLFLLRTNDEAMRYLDRYSPKDLNDVHAYIQTIEDGIARNTAIVWAIALKEDPRLIGTIAFHQIDKQNARAELGYMLMPEFWNKGLATEALQKIIGVGFNQFGFHSMIANINPGNEASRKLLLKAGFVKEAYFREDFYFNGRFIDSEIYALLQSDPRDY
ncbi:GNAT family N-acetyltransferase [Segetibacter sp. 3557_3]|uniref:GNAT family N-acetyltransferase n=1 Tax=Segetibacter sp. 3557_3 TaxID=2547429 RepID=UPI001404C675|nr:GNAT family N-acetyltransferase [Segetibacter sp. 3557_3]